MSVTPSSSPFVRSASSGNARCRYSSRLIILVMSVPSVRAAGAPRPSLCTYGYITSSRGDLQRLIAIPQDHRHNERSHVRAVRRTDDDRCVWPVPGNGQRVRADRAGDRGEVFGVERRSRHVLVERRDDFVMDIAAVDTDADKLKCAFALTIHGEPGHGFELDMMVTVPDKRRRGLERVL